MSISTETFLETCCDEIEEKEEESFSVSLSLLTSESSEEDKKLRFKGKKFQFWKLENTMNNYF